MIIIKTTVNKTKIKNKIIRTLLNNGVGVAEHPDIMDTVEKELDRISYWKDIKSSALEFDFESKKKTLVE